MFCTFLLAKVNSLFEITKFLLQNILFSFKNLDFAYYYKVYY